MAAPPSPQTAVLVGAGDLGTRIGLGLLERGREVVAIRRDVTALPEAFHPVAADLTDASVALPDLSADLLVVCLTADERDEGGYRRTYVEGMSRALDAVTRHGHQPARAILVSSTSVHGDSEEVVDESTAPTPPRATARVLVEAEAAFRAAIPGGTVTRMSGLYGGRDPRVVDVVRRGEDPDPHRWTNRIHRDDAAAAVVHLLTRDEEPEDLYLVTDDEPCQVSELRGYVAGLLDVPWTPAPAGPGVGKRISNARLRATGVHLTYPTYREGYRAVLLD